MGITEQDLERMQRRVRNAVAVGSEPVRAILPANFTVFGHVVSLNHSRASFEHQGKTITVKTKDAKEWAKMLETQLRAQWGPRLPVTCEVFVIYDIYLSANTMDYANGEKALSDALQSAGILKNDRLIRRGIITKFVDRHRPRVEFGIYQSTLPPL